MPSISDRAVPIVAPAARRPTTWMKRPSVVSRHGRCRSSCDAVHTSTSCCTKRKPAGITPTISYGTIVELDGAADGAPIATELVLPGAVAEDGDAWAVRTVVLVGDGAAKERCDAEQRKEFRGHQLRVHASRLAGAGHRERRTSCQAANRRNVRLSRCQSSQLAGETSARGLGPNDSSTITSWSPSGYGSGRSRS